MRAGKGLHVGVTVGLEPAGGASPLSRLSQQAAFLAEALGNGPHVSAVTLVCTSGPAPAPSWGNGRWPLAAFDDVAGELDVVVEVGGQVDAQRTSQLHARGAKLVSCCCSPEYLQLMQAVIFGKKLHGLGLFVNRAYDDLWVVPQAAPTSAAFFGTLRRRPVREVPFVWDPAFVEGHASYSPRPGPRRISVMEPNRDVANFCFYPALIADEAFRRAPEAIALLQVTDSMHLATQSLEFIALMNHLDVVRRGKALFLEAQAGPGFLASNTDVVVSHQWDQPVDALHLEACWLGWPLVHNAPLCADLGYYYRGNDTAEGCDRLLEAIAVHDARAGEYLERQRQGIARFLPSAPEVVGAYAALLDAVVAP